MKRHSQEASALVAEITLLCQRMAREGVPRTGYARLLRETIFFVWEGGNAEKYAPSRRRSLAANGLHRTELDYDHVVPSKYVIDELLALQPVTHKTVHDILDRFVEGVLITKEEHQRLSKFGLRSKMPPNWNGEDKFARYRAAGIVLSEPN